MDPSSQQQMAYGLRPGMVLGNRFELLRFVGRGGFGRVFEARDRLLGIDVAIKFLDPHFTEDEEQVSRFKREILLGRKVRHDNACQIFDFGEIDGFMFISMEFVDGQSLKERLGSDPPPSMQQLLQMVLQICAALDVAHRQGIVHRDLKLDNIMLDKADRVKVMDFGIAHSADTANMTSSNKLLGTPLYMSPERWRGEQAEAPSDIYALGVLMYQLFTGRPPFVSEEFVVVCFMHINDPPPPVLDLNPSLPAELAQIIERCVAKDPAARYADAGELWRALETLVPEGSIPEGLNALRSGPTPTRPSIQVTQEAVADAPATGKKKARKRQEAEEPVEAPQSGALGWMVGIVGVLLLIAIGGLAYVIVPELLHGPTEAPTPVPTPVSVVTPAPAAEPTPDPKLVEARAEAEKLYAEGRYIEDGGDLDALRAFQRVLQIRPFDPDALDRIRAIAASFGKTGDEAFSKAQYDVAIEQYGRALKADPGDASLRQKFDAAMEKRKLAASVSQLLHDARRALDRFEPKQAQELLIAIRRDDPNNADAAALEVETKSQLEALELLASGRQKLAQGDFVAANDAATRLLASHPEWIEGKELANQIDTERKKADERARIEAEEKARLAAEERAKREAEAAATAAAAQGQESWVRPTRTPEPEGWANEAVRRQRQFNLLLDDAQKALDFGELNSARAALGKAERLANTADMKARVEALRRAIDDKAGAAKPAPAPTLQRPAPTAIPKAESSRGLPDSAGSGSASETTSAASAAAPVARAAAPSTETREVGTVQFLVQPWAQVRVDGAIVGTTPFKPIELAVGTHEIVLENSDLGARMQKSVQVAAGQKLLVREDLSVGWLDLEPQPAAQASWRELPDGKLQDAGRTPITVKVPAGRPLELVLEVTGKVHRFQVTVPGGGRLPFRKALGGP